MAAALSANGASKLKKSSGEHWLFFGPCSAESREQVLGTARQLHQHFERLTFRAGLWKPRTRPNSFEGVGEMALPWLAEVKAETGFTIATEVATARHVEICLEHNIDVLWIGARTTVNPFQVQELADALAGANVPVFVKNPIHPDLQLWLGAIERLLQRHTGSVGAIHRGFHLLDNQAYRNHPQWDIPIKLKAENPELPLVTDASHISGKPELIPHIAQKSLDLDMDGLMVETHSHPAEALSDAQQQITPEQLHRLYENLIHKKPSSSKAGYSDQLEKLRRQIDQIDDHLLHELARRMEVAREIGAYKRHNQVTVLQVQRWQKILQQRRKLGEALGLSGAFVEDLLHSIHKESITQQFRFFDESPENEFRGPA